MANSPTRSSRANARSINAARLREPLGMGYMSRRLAGPGRLAGVGRLSRRLGAPKLMCDSHSEPSTPLVTPTDNEFEITKVQEGSFGEFTTNQGSIGDRPLRMDLDPMDNDKENLPPNMAAAYCPPAPCIDTGIFDYNLIHEHEQHSNSSIDPGMIMDSNTTANTSTETSFDSNEGYMSLDGSSIVGEMEVDAMLNENGLGSSCNNRTALQFPSAPRPDTGSWSSRAANAAPRYSMDRNRDARQTRTHQHHKLSQPQSQNVAWSVTPDKLGSSVFSPTSEDAYSPRWNLGLGLTLDTIAEPSYTMDFDEDSPFDVDLGDSSRPDLLPEVATPCPQGRRYQNWKAYDSDIAPQLKMLSLQNPGCQRRQEQDPVVSTSGTQLFACSKDRADKTPAHVGQSLDERGLCGRSETKIFGAAEKVSLNERERSLGQPCDQAQEIVIFSLLPPIEL